MKNIIVILSLFLSLNIFAEEKKELTILHTNDTHSCILPWNTNLADTTLAGRGGFLRRITMLKEERKIQSSYISTLAISSKARHSSPCSVVRWR